MEYLLSAIWSVMEVYAYCLICHGFFEPNLSTKPSYRMLAILWITTQLNLNSSLNTFFQQIITIASCLAVSWYIYKRKWYQHILIFLFWYILNGAIDTVFMYGTCGLLKISFHELVWNKALYIFSATIGKIFFVSISWLCYRFWIKQLPQPTNQNWLILSLLFPSVSVVLLWLVFINSQRTSGASGRVIMTCVILLVADIAVIYYMSQKEKNARSERELVLLHRQMEIQSAHIQTLEKRYRSQRASTHEFRSQLQTISGLLAQGKPDAAVDYVDQLLGNQTLRLFPVNSHNALLDALLNQEYQSAIEQNIDIQFQVSDLSQLPLEMDKMVVLLSNLLDNAIEGCCRIATERILYCRLIQNEDVLEISVRNTSAPVTIIDNTIPTSKAPTYEHGYGLSQIKYLINDFRGTYAMDCSDGWFTFVAEIPLIQASPQRKKQASV